MNKKKKYTLLKLLYICLGYLSMGVFIFSLILITLGEYNLFFIILLIISILAAIVTTKLDQYYQTKIDEIDYDDLPF